MSDDLPYYLKGKDNYGRPRTEYRDKIVNMTEKEYIKEAEMKIWLSAFAGNNPRSDYHWHVDVLFEESQRRGKTELYNEAFEKAKRSCG